MTSLVRSVSRFRPMLAPFLHRYHRTLINHFPVPATGQPTPPTIISSMRMQMYSTGSAGSTDRLSDLSRRVTVLEKTCVLAIEKGFAKLKTELVDHLEDKIEKSLVPVSDMINNARLLNRWLLGALISGVLLKTLFWDRGTEEKFLEGIGDSETKLGQLIRDSEGRVIKMVEEALLKFKFGLKAEELEKKDINQDKR
ncbi:hypothetical protein B9Z19DRAFT_1196299 [Tuber borchii]|uniref:Uncharacterized protein n=1 Tax=Tuber borchii TaxID=42251 RepID=A0A2T6ZFX4_TUBBO|nr:hypothetical protein B9Z19DRAFT_1196299 [Tuber borchii]